MPSLDELKGKWFLDLGAPETSFPPPGRYPRCPVSNYTDGNEVTFLIDGEEYMKRWYDIINTLRAPDCEVYHSAAWLEPVPVLGQSTPASNALEVMRAANGRGVRLYFLLNDQLNAILSNQPTATWLAQHGMHNIRWDDRYPDAGSHHSKYIVLKNPSSPDRAIALVASCDLVPGRWDTNLHLPLDSNRPTRAPTHEVGMQVRGPAVRDIELSFRDRWNDRRPRDLPVIVSGDGGAPFVVQLPLPPAIQSAIAAPPQVGTHSVQVLHTYGITTPEKGYPWSATGEFSIWCAYLNAIKRAENYIYIEEQYFLPFGSPPLFRGGPRQDSDIVFQLGERIRHGVPVIVLIPKKSEDDTLGVVKVQRYQRNVGVQYLTEVAAASGGTFIIAYLNNNIPPVQFDVYVHGKLMIVDDEFILAGTANICRRSMTTDGELHLGIVDAQNTLPRQLRMTLWAEHLQDVVPDDLNQAIDLFRAYVEDEQMRQRNWLARVRPYVPEGARPWLHQERLDHMVDPYSGPT